MRESEAIAAARKRVGETGKMAQSRGFAGIATKGSQAAFSAIAGARSIGSKALEEHRKANQILADLLEEQRQNRIGELTMQGAV